MGKRSGTEERWVGDGRSPTRLVHESEGYERGVAHLGLIVIVGCLAVIAMGMMALVLLDKLTGEEFVASFRALLVFTTLLVVTLTPGARVAAQRLTRRVRKRIRRGGD